MTSKEDIERDKDLISLILSSGYYANIKAAELNKNISDVISSVKEIREGEK